MKVKKYGVIGKQIVVVKSDKLPCGWTIKIVDKYGWK